MSKTSFRCTYALDREEVVTFVLENDVDCMEEAIGLALNTILNDEVSPSNLLGFSVLKIATNPPYGTNPPDGRDSH